MTWEAEPPWRPVCEPDPDPVLRIRRSLLLEYVAGAAAIAGIFCFSLGYWMGNLSGEHRAKIEMAGSR